MRYAVLAAAMSLSIASAGAAAPNALSDVPLLPMPARVAVGVGSFRFDQAQIVALAAGALASAQGLRSPVGLSGGPARHCCANGAVRFHLDPRVSGREAYRLAMTTLQ